MNAAIVAPCGPVDPAKLHAGVAVLRSWGVEVVVGEHVLDVPDDDAHADAMLSATDESRLADLQWALCDPSIHVVCAARGGYGLTRILDRVDWEAAQRATHRPVLGFSDVTALHEAFRVRLGRPTIHGPNIGGTFGDGDGDSIDHLRAYLLEGNNDCSAALLTAEVLRHGSVVAPIFGGNLAMLASIAGTVDGQAPTLPFVALLEDVNEAPYKVDRMLVQLRRSGWFDRCVGVLGGTWRGCGDASELRAVVLDQLGSIDGPIVIDAGIGHTERNIAVPLGVPTRFDTRTRALIVEP